VEDILQDPNHGLEIHTGRGPLNSLSHDAIFLQLAAVMFNLHKHVPGMRWLSILVRLISPGLDILMPLN
jgi:hypothetical protein